MDLEYLCYATGPILDVKDLLNPVDIKNGQGGGCICKSPNRSQKLLHGHKSLPMDPKLCTKLASECLIVLENWGLGTCPRKSLEALETSKASEHALCRIEYTLFHH